MFQVTGDREEMYSNLEKDLIAQVGTEENSTHENV